MLKKLTLSFFKTPYTLLRILQSHRRQKFIYGKMHKKYPGQPQSLHWKGKKEQRLRFEAFMEVGNLQKKEILDIGSGLGDFFSFLLEKNIRCHLNGYEIVKPFVIESQKKYPHAHHAHIEKRNILLHPPSKSFDYIFSSGIFAFGNQDFFHQMVLRALRHTRIAYAFNLYEPSHNSLFFKQSKGEVISFCRTLPISTFKLIDDYMPNDFTVILYK